MTVFGAGMHTRTLLPLWKQLGGPPVNRIIVSDPRDANDMLEGIPVCGVSDVRCPESDAVILSSMTFEPEMAEACKRWPEIPMYAPWLTAGPPDPATSWERSVALLRRTVPSSRTGCDQMAFTTFFSVVIRQRSSSSSGSGARGTGHQSLAAFRSSTKHHRRSRSLSE